MYRKYFFCVFLLCFITLVLSAQRYVSGRITDFESGSPIPGAHVFIAGTTVGTTTDSEGSYRLGIPGSGSYRIAVSHAGYEPVFRDIEPGKASTLHNFSMNAHEMEEVTIIANIQFRKRDIDLFWRTLLGRNPSKKTIHVINPETVYYFYNSETQKLTVTCRQPLKIVNHETGYLINYVLNYFTHDYRTKFTSWKGECMFEELEPVNYKQKNTWEKNRQKVHIFSIHRFIKSLYYNSLMTDGFLLTHIGEGFQGNGIPARSLSLPNVKDFLSSGSDDSSKTLYIPSDSAIILVCYGKPVDDTDMQVLQRAQNRWSKWNLVGSFRNQLQTPSDTVRIYSDGTFSNTLLFVPEAISRPITGINMMLPIEYDSDSATMNDAIIKMEYDPDQWLVNALDSVAKRFDKQLSVFPQEKVYLHTDKPYYVSGERIWFRAHVVDAATHTPVIEVNCVFAELLDIRDSVVSRVKIGVESDAFSGYIPIPEDIPEGDYMLRAYTNTMRNLTEDYFFLKNIWIGSHQTRLIQTFSEFEFTTKNKIGTDIRFSTTTPSAPPVPQSVKISINSEKPMKVKCKNSIAGINFKLPPDEKQRAILLDAMYDQHPYRQFIKIPLPEDDFDVLFYPEGGSALYGAMGRFAVKAMQRDGTDINVSGVVYDRWDNEITRFKTDIRGMGQFILTPLKDEERYYAVCANQKGHSKRFELPAARSDGFALSTEWSNDYLNVKALQPEVRKTPDTMCLIIHTRGVVQDILIWENINEQGTIHRDFFPSGVSNLLLLTKDMIPVSERLVFVYNDDQANVVCKTDKAVYSVRSPVEYTVNLTDVSGDPMEGSFSVSVTNDHEVAVDTASNILTTMLLSSDLQGNIPDPAFYFRNNTQSAYALELLMLTQGWRRYDTKRIVHNDFMRPDTLFEKGFEISGKLEDMFRMKPLANTGVSLFSLSGDFFAETVTDRNGRFYLHDGNAPDSTWFIVQKTVPSSKENAELILNRATYPERRVPMVASVTPNHDIFVKYADKIEQQYVDEHGTRVIRLSDVTITAKKKPEQRSSYYHTADRSIIFSNANEIGLSNRASSFRALMYQLPGVSYVSQSDTAGFVVQFARFPDGCPAMFLVDDFPIDDASWLNISDIVQIDLLTSPINLSMFGDRGKCGVIAIHTRSGKGAERTSVKKSYYSKSIMPLGFQKPAEYYAPKYDHPEQNTKPDMRTTIHWQPNVTTNENGTASFSFYTADAPATYTVVIEGITDDGKIICKRDKVMVSGK